MKNRSIAYKKRIRKHAKNSKTPPLLPCGRHECMLPFLGGIEVIHFLKLTRYEKQKLEMIPLTHSCPGFYKLILLHERFDPQFFTPFCNTLKRKI